MVGNRGIRLVALIGSATLALALLAGAARAEDWPTYLHDAARSSTSGETAISTTNAGQLGKLWSFHTGGGVAASPTIVGGVVYVGSWDGYEYALDAATGALKWKTFVGITNGAASCPFPATAGVTSSATVANGVVYVGGGDSFWYALDASTGAVLWKVFSGDNSVTGGHYNWSSPLLYNGAAYIGVASLGDCPLVQGELLRVDLSTHQVTATFKAVPDGHVGGGIWTSPVVDAASNTIYVTTGTQVNSTDTHAAAIVALDATTLTVKGSWQVPLADQVADNDWGTSPTLISGGMVVATNKNGVVYAFQRSNISAGPVWQQKIANGGDCPVCGDGSVSSDAFDGTQLYVGGSKTSVGNIAFPGSISALDPATGHVNWRQGLQGFVIPALASVNGLVLAGVGSNFTVLSAANGNTLFSYATGNTIFSPAAVSGGRIFVGSQDGSVYAFAVGAGAPPPNTVRVNAGGASYTDTNNNTWSADCCNSGGNTFSTTAPISGTSDPVLYQSERWSTGTFTYTFNGLAAGTYQVTMKFAEIASLGPRQRRFNVAINGSRVLTNLDVATEVGQNAADDKTFAATVGSNGQLTVTFSKGASDNPIIGAIQVAPDGTPPPPPPPPPPGNTVRVNAGGASYTDGSANVWSADCCNSGGNTFSTTASIAGTSDPTLYQSERWSTGPFTYSFTGLAAGSYQVTLKFAETAGLGPGQRQFNVVLNGAQVLTNLDVAAQAGENTALDKTFTTTVDTSGNLSVAFTKGAADNPIVSAIQVVPDGTPPPPPPPGNTVRVNAGGASYTDGSANVWSADCCNSGGNTFSTTASIAGTSDPTLYQSERWSTGPFTYSFTGLAAGSYQVTLKFAETAGLGPGQRRFNVAVNGTQVLSNLDVAAEVGENTADDKTFTTTVDTSGNLSVAFTKGASDNPIVSAIQVVPDGAAPATAALSFKTGAQVLTAGQPSSAMGATIPAAVQSPVTVALSSSSSAGLFAASASGPWSAGLNVTVPAGQTASGSFFYKDTKSGSPTLTASATGYTNATQNETVNAAALAAITVSPGTATVVVGFTQGFTAAGADQFGNAVGVSGAAWSTSVAGGAVSPATGTATTFTAGSTTGGGLVTATVGAIAGSATVTVAPLPAPTGLTASAKGKGRIQLSWQGGGTGITYSVYRGTAAGQESTTAYASGLTSASYTDTGAASGTTYYYYVVAFGPGGNQSTASGEASATAG